MNLGDKLIELRKEKHLSQEEVADKLNVTRQTVSKWELNQSLPDFDKIVPLCELYEITSDELLRGAKVEKEENIDINIYNDVNKKKRTTGLIAGILAYFVAIAWIMISIPVMRMNPIVASALFIIICGVGTCIIIYSCSVYKKIKPKKEEVEEDKSLIKHIESVLSILTVIIYLYISFRTFAWHITWIIWLIYALVIEIIKLLISLGGKKDE